MPKGPIVTTIAENYGYFITASEGLQLPNDARQRSLQTWVPLPTDLKDRVASIVNNPDTDCASFIKMLVATATGISGKAFSDDPMKVFERVNSQGGLKLRNTSPYGGQATREGNKRVVHINPVLSSSDPRLIEHIQNAYAVTALNEIMHHARKSGVYDDRTLSRAIFTLLTPEQRAEHPLPKTSNVEVNSAFSQSIQAALSLAKWGSK